MPTPSQAATLRVFVAVRLNTALTAHVQATQDALKRAVPPRSVRWTTPEQWHLTLKFFGNVHLDEVGRITAALQQAGRDVPPFRLTVDGIGCFPSRQRPSVLWLGISGEVNVLGALQANVERECGVFGSHSETRAFHPHLTLGRVKAVGSELRRVGEGVGAIQAPLLGDWPVFGMELMQSRLGPQGSTYSVLAEIKLGAV